jgi:hypothetical protein
MSITYISNSTQSKDLKVSCLHPVALDGNPELNQSKELNMSRWIHTIDIIHLLKAGLTDE